MNWLRTPALGLIGLTVLSGCARMSEAEMRVYLAQWFSVGETLSFAAQQGCVAGVFKLDDLEIGAGLPVTGSIPQAAARLRDGGLMALDQSGLSPDQALVDMANQYRDYGMQMRRTGLEGRPCMDELAESAFSYALQDHEALLGYDLERGALFVVDRAHALLVITIGERV